MNYTAKEVLNFIKENDVKFVRLTFCDLFGVQKNIAIMADRLEEAFENGITFDAYAIKGFKDVTESDLLLFPNPTTVGILPWRPGVGRVARFYCDIKNPDCSVFLLGGRSLLKEVLSRADRMGYVCKVGAECEFYLFKLSEEGEPTMIPFDRGGYLDIAPLDKGENIRREICLTLSDMGIDPETSHHEQGPGQNEVSFKFGNALESADNLLTFKTVVKAVAQRNGLYASFMPKPILDAPGSGLHINISLSQNGRNIFKSAASGEKSETMESFIAGVLNRVGEISAFLNPIANSYERLGKFEAPKYISWSHHNRSQLIRLPEARGEKVRMELRSPDPAVNPYLAFALIISAGLDGIESNAKLPSPVDADLFAADESITKNLSKLPDTLSDAIALLESSEFAKRVMGENLLSRYLKVKKAEAEEFSSAKDKMEFYKAKYFPIY